MFPLIRCIHRRSKTLPHLQVRDVGDVLQSRKVSCNRPADASNGGFFFRLDCQLRCALLKLQLWEKSRAEFFKHSHPISKQAGEKW